MMIACSGCEFAFDPMDDRAWISTTGPDGRCLCPLCATLVLRSSDAWAVWNDCNGIFTDMVTTRRREAEAIIARDGLSAAGCTAVPVKVIREPADDEFMRHWCENRA